MPLAGATGCTVGEFGANVTTEVRQHCSPEEQELRRKQDEVAVLQAELAERELRLATLQMRPHAFERRCM